MFAPTRLFTHTVFAELQFSRAELEATWSELGYAACSVLMHPDDSAAFCEFVQGWLLFF